MTKFRIVDALGSERIVSAKTANDPEGKSADCAISIVELFADVLQRYEEATADERAAVGAEAEEARARKERYREAILEFVRAKLTVIAHYRAAVEKLTEDVK